MPGAFHRARSAAGRHEAVGPSSTRLRHTGHRTVSGAVAHIADRFTHNRSFSALFNEVACGLGSTTPRVADSLPSDGGNCIIRDLTRRRHAASQLLMLQNPHTRRHGRRRVADKTWVQRWVARNNSPSTPRTPPLPVQNSPSTRHTPPVPVQNSPCMPKMALFGGFCAYMANFVPFLSSTSRAGRVFSRTSPTPSRARKKQRTNTTIPHAIPTRPNPTPT